MTILVVQAAIKDYGSTYDEDRFVRNHSPSPSKTTTTKGRVACLLLGLTAAVVLGAAATRTDAEASLLHRTDGTCVVQSGAWPAHTESIDDDDVIIGSPYATCFVFQVDNGVDKPGAFCWSRSYQNKDGDWKPCKPLGYGSDGWTEWVGADDDVDTGVIMNSIDNKSNGPYGPISSARDTVSACGPPCTAFE